MENPTEKQKVEAKIITKKVIATDVGLEEPHEFEVDYEVVPPEEMGGHEGYIRKVPGEEHIRDLGPVKKNDEDKK